MTTSQLYPRADRVGQDIELAFPRLATVAGTATLPEASTGLERTESFGGGRGHWGFDELPPGRYRVSVRSIEGAGATDVALEAGQERRDLVVPLQPRVIVTVVMRDLDTDEPLAEVDVSALDREASIPDLAAEGEKGLAMGNRERRSDAGGRLVIRRPPGSLARAGPALQLLGILRLGQRLGPAGRAARG